MYIYKPNVQICSTEIETKSKKYILVGPMESLQVLIPSGFFGFLNAPWKSFLHGV